MQQEDQGDRESVFAKTVICSYVGAGNNLLKAEDVYEALHYGVKDEMVCVAKIDYAKSSISGPKISQFTSYY